MKLRRTLSLLLVIGLFFSLFTGMVGAADAADFTDISPYAWYYDSVQYAVEHEIVYGTSDTTFSPNRNITRAQFITLLYRAFGQGEVVSPSREFSDVPADSYYRNAVYWGQAHEIVYGKSAELYAPDADITRQEATVMMGRAITSLSLEVDVPDQPVSAFCDESSIAVWAKDAVELMHRKGLVTGYKDGSFGPNRRMTRAEGTTVLVRLYQHTSGEDITQPTEDRIHFISLSGASSDATLIESNGKYMLVDAGNPTPAVGGNYAVSDPSANGDAVVSYLASIGVTHLDCLVMTHNHSDHIGGVPTICDSGLINADTTVYYRARRETDEDTTTDWQNLEYLDKALSKLEAANATIVSLTDTNTTELAFDLGDFHITFRNLDEDHDGSVDFFTTDENRNSLVLMVTKGSVTTVLAADLGVPGEKTLLANGGFSDVDILKLSHHGFSTSNGYDWLRTTAPSATVLTHGQWYTGEGDGMASYAYLHSKGIPVYACDGAKKAVVFTIGTRNYFVSDVGNDGHQAAAVKLGQTIPDGFYYWNRNFADENNTVKVENGTLVRNASRTDAYGDTYYFNQDGVGTPE